MASRISSSEKGVRAAAGGAAAGAHVRGDERAAHVAELPSHDCNRGPVAGVEALGAPILAAAAGPGRVPVEDGRRRAVLLAPAFDRGNDLGPREPTRRWRRQVRRAGTVRSEQGIEFVARVAHTRFLAMSL